MKTIFNIPLFNKTGTDNTKNNYIICGEATHKLHANRLEFKPSSFKYLTFPCYLSKTLKF